MSAHSNKLIEELARIAGYIGDGLSLGSSEAEVIRQAGIEIGVLDLTAESATQLALRASRDSIEQRKLFTQMQVENNRLLERARKAETELNTLKEMQR